MPIPSLPSLLSLLCLYYKSPVPILSLLCLRSLCMPMLVTTYAMPTWSPIYTYLDAAVAYGYDAGLPIRRSQVRCSPLLLFPWARNFTPNAPVCCADGYTTVLLCRVLVVCMSYQGTAEKQYFYTEQSSLLINPLTFLTYVYAYTYTYTYFTFINSSSCLVMIMTTACLCTVRFHCLFNAFVVI